MTAKPRVLIIEARFYEDLAEQLLQGAMRELLAADAEIFRAATPGILELPAALNFAVRAMETKEDALCCSGFVILGCAVKGETDHYEHICQEAMRGIQDLVLVHALAVGNGIVAARTWEQAVDRCNPDAAGRNFGGRAAKACLRMIELKRDVGLQFLKA